MSRKGEPLRVIVVGLAALTVAIGWPLSNKVSALRIEHYNPDTALAGAAKAAFSQWHLASLGLSMMTAVLVGVALAIAAKMPEKPASAHHE